MPLLRLGVGSRADVYLGRLEGLEGLSTPVVMKRALGNQVSDDEARATLLWEGQVAAACRHPHVVATLELTEIPEGTVLVTEYVSGVTLGALMRHLAREDAPVPGPIAARIVADAAQGLAHVHRATDQDERPMHLVHGDVSPNNLLLGEDGYVRVSDFGCARPESRDPSAMFMATPPYCAPEQIRGEALLAATDVFALGMVLRALLIGGAPVLGDDMDAQIQNAATGNFVPLSPYTDSVLAQLIRDMTAAAPMARPSMQEVGDRLEELSIGRGGSRNQLRSFLQSEMGDALAKRRRRLRAIEEGAETLGAHGSTATFAILDSLLDGELPELDGTYVDRHAKGRS